MSSENQKVNSFNVSSWFNQLLKQLASDGWVMSDKFELEHKILSKLISDQKFDKSRALMAESNILNKNWNDEFKRGGLQIEFFYPQDWVLVHVKSLNERIREIKADSFNEGMIAQKDKMSDSGYAHLERELSEYCIQLGRIKLDIAELKVENEHIQKECRLLKYQLEKSERRNSELNSKILQYETEESEFEESNGFQEDAPDFDVGEILAKNQTFQPKINSTDGNQAKSIGALLGDVPNFSKNNLAA